MDSPAQRPWETHYVLNLGCGIKAKVKNGINVDINPQVEPDVVWDLNKLPLPFEDEKFDRCMMFHVLEHLGDPMAIKKPYVEWFFEFWREIWRVLKADGLVQVVCPSAESNDTWGDPGHVRIITPSTFDFLFKGVYEMNRACGSPMTQYGIDFDFEPLQPTVITPDNKFVVALLIAKKVEKK